MKRTYTLKGKGAKETPRLRNSSNNALSILMRESLPVEVSSNYTKISLKPRKNRRATFQNLESKNNLLRPKLLGVLWLDRKSGHLAGLRTWLE